VDSRRTIRHTAFRNHSALAVPYLTAFARLNVEQKWKQVDVVSGSLPLHPVPIIPPIDWSSKSSRITPKKHRTFILNLVPDPTIFANGEESVSQSHD
jgi:hypothetical protein